MTKPNPLSPAAQAVWEAFNQFDHAGMHVDYGIKMAAALRAAADQVVPHPDQPDKARLGMGIRWKLLAIASELEAQNP